MEKWTPQSLAYSLCLLSLNTLVQSYALPTRVSRALRWGSGVHHASVMDRRQAFGTICDQTLISASYEITPACQPCLPAAFIVLVPNLSVRIFWASTPQYSLLFEQPLLTHSA